jgi:hypothetical protein
VVHHQDEPRGMGVVFANLRAEMQLRVIDAINWYRARAGSSGADRVFRTRELTPDELAIDEIDETTSRPPVSRSPASAARDVVAESGSYASLSASSVEERSGPTTSSRPGRSAPPPPAARAEDRRPAPRPRPRPPRRRRPSRRRVRGLLSPSWPLWRFAAPRFLP